MERAEKHSQTVLGVFLAKGRCTPSLFRTKISLVWFRKRPLYVVTMFHPKQNFYHHSLTDMAFDMDDLNNTLNMAYVLYECYEKAHIGTKGDELGF